MTLMWSSFGMIVHESVASHYLFVPLDIRDSTRRGWGFIGVEEESQSYGGKADANDVCKTT